MARQGGSRRAKRRQHETGEDDSPPADPIREPGQDERAERRKRHPGEQFSQFRLVQAETLGNPW